MVRDNEVCRIQGCTVHPGWAKVTSSVKRDEQIVEDWTSGDWTVDELSSFWGLKSPLIDGIVGRVTTDRAGTPPLEVAYSR